MTDENISFEKFLSLEKLFKGKTASGDIMKAFQKISSYILLNRQINIAKINDIKELEKLIEEIKNDHTYATGIDEASQIAALEKYCDYKSYINGRN